jgi:hypothetical protein
VSIGAAIEAFTGAKFGSSGTLTAAHIITAAVKAVPEKQVGYSGLMVPVLEDKVLAQRWAESTYDVDSLLAYSAVCGTGLDTIPLPGDVSLEQRDAYVAQRLVDRRPALGLGDELADARGVERCELVGRAGGAVQLLHWNLVHPMTCQVHMPYVAADVMSDVEAAP